MANGAAKRASPLNRSSYACTRLSSTGRSYWGAATNDIYALYVVGARLTGRGILHRGARVQPPDAARREDARDHLCTARPNQELAAVGRHGRGQGGRGSVGPPLRRGAGSTWHHGHAVSPRLTDDSVLNGLPQRGAGLRARLARWWMDSDGPPGMPA